MCTVLAPQQACINRHVMRMKSSVLNTNCLVVIENNFISSTVITTNMQNALNTTDTGTTHTYIISKYDVIHDQGRNEVG